MREPDMSTHPSSSRGRPAWCAGALALTLVGCEPLPLSPVEAPAPPPPAAEPAASASTPPAPPAVGALPAPEKPPGRDLMEPPPQLSPQPDVPATYPAGVVPAALLDSLAAAEDQIAINPPLAFALQQVGIDVFFKRGGRSGAAAKYLVKFQIAL